MSSPLALGLCTLELRRSIRRVAVPTLALLVLMLAFRGAPDRDAGIPLSNPAALRGLFREELWSVALLALLPLAIFRAARIPAGWRAGEADWIGSRPVGRARAIASAWVGLTLALLGTLSIVGFSIEAQLDGRGSAPVSLGAYPLPAVVRVEPGTQESVNLPASVVSSLPEKPLTARVRLTILPGGDPTSAVRLQVNGGEASEGLVDGRTWIETTPLIQGGTLELELLNLGGGRLALLDSPGIELWQAGGKERWAWVALAIRAALVLGWATALAIAFGTWIGSFSAGASVLAIWLGTLILPRVPEGWSTASLPDALRIIAQNRVPGAIDGRALLAALALTLAAWGLGRLGLRSWRYTP